MRRMHTIKSFFLHRIKTVFSLDLRGLAILRIGLAIILIIDLTYINSDLRALLTDSGILPNDLLLTNYRDENGRAFHSLSGAYWRQVTLMILNYGVLFGLLIGRKTRRMHLLAWLFFCSLSAKNPIILNGGDAVLRMILFWAMFLPTAHRRSIDTRKQEKPKNTAFLSRATVGFITQIFFVYIRNFILKTDAQRQSTFTATYTALSLDMLRTSRGTRLYQFPELMKWITHFRIILEGRGRVLFILPFKNHRGKIVCCVLFIGVHASMALTMKIGHFPRTCIVVRASLLPGAFRNSVVPVHGNKTNIGNGVKILKDVTSETTVRDGDSPISYVANFNKIGYIERKRNVRTSRFLVICLLYIFMRNLRASNFDKRDDYFPRTINRFGFLLRLDQYRSMFSPYPLEDDGWFIVQGTTESFRKINLLDQSVEVRYDKPHDFDRLFPHEKRRKLFLNFRSKEYAQFRAPYLQRHCRERNKAHPSDPLLTASMEYAVERTKPDYQVQTGEVVMLQAVDCE